MPIVIKKRVAEPISPVFLPSPQVEQSKTVILSDQNSKIKPWNEQSIIPYLEFWVSGELVGADHILPEYEAEIVDRFYKKYGVVKGKVKERITDEKAHTLFNPGARALC